MKKIIIEVEEDIHRQIKLIAAAMGITMKDLMLRYIKEILKENVLNS